MSQSGASIFRTPVCVFGRAIWRFAFACLKKTSMYSKTSVLSSAFHGQLRPWMSSYFRVAKKALGDGVIEAIAAAAYRLGDARRRGPAGRR